MQKFQTRKKLMIIVVAGFLFFSPIIVSANLTDDLKAQIASIQIQIVALQTKLSQIFSQLTRVQNQATSSQAVITPNNLACETLSTSELKFNDANTGVLTLQKVLNSSIDTRIATVGDGSPGHETGRFGGLTYQALIRFQEKHSSEILTPAGLIKGSGFVGQTTRAKLKNVCSSLKTSSSPTVTSNGGSGGNSASVSTPSNPTPIQLVGSGGNTSAYAGQTSQTPTPTIPVKPTAPPPIPINTSSYPVHTNITATVFWVGEPKGGGSSEDNALSAWDDAWEAHYGGYDDYQNRNGYLPVGFTPKENPFYLDVPYNDFNDNGTRKPNSSQVVPWANEKVWSGKESMMKNRWVKLTRNGNICYGQIEDAGPYEYDDFAYVFGSGTTKPKSTLANNAGLDVSPALRDCLKFSGLNNDNNSVDWQFVNASDVPTGPWKQIVTTSQINWP